MSRYIDADKIEYEDMLRPRGNGNYKECKIAYQDQIDDIPTADVRENVKGEWTDFSTSIKGVPTEACGACGEWSLGMGKNFCPNCGADMRGEA